MTDLPSAPPPPFDPPSADRAGYAVGTTIAGKYRLVRRLEEGGMGAVWVAHHLALDVQVALKIVLPDPGASNADARLIREARSAAQLDHPGIVRVLDVGRTYRGDAFLVMELLVGETLAELLARDRKLDAATGIRTLLPVVGAMCAMHDKGMIHRDLKPENIFLARDDTGHKKPKLIDFGLARTSGGPSSARLTERGVVVGTPCYMAPEQIRGGEVDARADVWSMAIVLYELITGVLPFGPPEKTPLAVALGTAPEPLSKHGVDDPDLWAILQRGISPLGERWSTMRELGRALAAWLWRRSETRDITGVSLQETWLANADLMRLSIPDEPFRVRTARFPDAALTPSDSAAAPISSKPARAAIAPAKSAPEGAPPRAVIPGPPSIPAMSGGVTTSEAPRASRSVSLGIAAFVILAAVAAAGLWWMRRGGDSGPAEASSGAVSPTAPRSASAPSAAPPRTSPPLASAPPASSAPAPAVTPRSTRPTAPPIPQGLKDPYR